MFKKSCIFHSLMDFQIGRHTVCHKLFPWDVLCRWKDVTYFIIYHSIFLGAQACVLAFSTVDRDSFEAIESWKKKVSTEGYSCFLCVCLLEPCHNEHLPLHAFKWKCFVNRNLKSWVWERNYIATAWRLLVCYLQLQKNGDYFLIPHQRNLLMMTYLNRVNTFWWCRKRKIIFEAIYICLWIFFVMITGICHGFKLQI